MASWTSFSGPFALLCARSPRRRRICAPAARGPRPVATASCCFRDLGRQPLHNQGRALWNWGLQTRECVNLGGARDARESTLRRESRPLLEVHGRWQRSAAVAETWGASPDTIKGTCCRIGGCRLAARHTRLSLMLLCSKRAEHRARPMLRDSLSAWSGQANPTGGELPHAQLT